jgi:hypothetical protein
MLAQVELHHGVAFMSAKPFERGSGRRKSLAVIIGQTSAKLSSYARVLSVPSIVPSFDDLYGGL